MKKNVFNTMITWYRASEVLPVTDGNYLCYHEGSDRIIELPYCSEARLFNVSKDYTETAIEVLWWAEVPAMPCEEN